MSGKYALSLHVYDLFCQLSDTSMSLVRILREGWVKLPDQNYVNMDGYRALALTLLAESFQVLRYVPHYAT